MMPWQCSFKKLCFYAPIMQKIMLAQYAKAYVKVEVLTLNSIWK